MSMTKRSITPYSRNSKKKYIFIILYHFNIPASIIFTNNPNLFSLSNPKKENIPAPPIMVIILPSTKSPTK